MRKTLKIANHKTAMVSTMVQNSERGSVERVERWLAKKHFGVERVVILIFACLLLYTIVFSFLSISNILSLI